MNATKGQLEIIVEKEIEKIRGNYTPVKTSFLRRRLTRFLKCSQLHPNPGDEFCDPSIGPSNEIISGYMKAIRFGQKHGEDRFLEDPVTVEKITPDGYILLNGHHRWAAAIKTGIPKIRVEIINLTQQKDIHDMLGNAKHPRRAAVDLDEVVFRTEYNELTEKPLRFPFSRIYRDPMRLGIPALFNYLNEHGYDIWVYTARYYSFESIQQYFWLHHTRVCGVVTGTRRKTSEFAAARARMEKLMSEQYEYTLHIDNDSIVRIDNRTKDYEDYEIKGPAIEWARRVADIIGEIEKREKTASPEQ